MHEFGFIWNSDPAAPLEFLGNKLENNPVEEYWNDFENMYNMEGKTADEKQWAQMAFIYMYQHMTGSIGSGQVHLMFNPQEFHQQYPQWTSPDNIASESWDYWLYPGNPSQDPLPEMGYFPIVFLTDMLSGSFHVNNHNQNYLSLIDWYLREIWKRWHPE